MATIDHFWPLYIRLLYIYYIQDHKIFSALIQRFKCVNINTFYTCIVYITRRIYIIGIPFVYIRRGIYTEYCPVYILCESSVLAIYMNSKNFTFVPYFRKPIWYICDFEFIDLKMRHYIYLICIYNYRYSNTIKIIYIEYLYNY